MHPLPIQSSITVPFMQPLKKASLRQPADRGAFFNCLGFGEMSINLPIHKKNAILQVTDGIFHFWMLGLEAHPPLTTPSPVGKPFTKPCFNYKIDLALDIGEQ